ncbi:nucleotide sugar dehydrogenase [Polynucleobacter difficilis]|uniref:nucleotide sugar dehydrogenase n=1 Tax=Polynucleobacter difficilis TaxID=556054 RepID=UPI000D3A1380|nr:nucleotide sugar dehydrogenase [Polynucleobacter difficilis]
MNLLNKTVAIIGLGYVGLPLAVEFGKRLKVIGFDINRERIKALEKGFDETLEVSSEELTKAHYLSFTCNAEDLKSAQVFIITVPTPVDNANCPDLTPLINASSTVGAALHSGDTVIYESTVFPGATEEVCVPILQKYSGLKYIQAFDLDLMPNFDGGGFYCGYSPERINPGDKKHRLPDIKKVTSGSTPEVAEAIDALYRSIISAGTHKASSIRVAEAAKVIENTQRDLNIALMNELSLIFHRLGIDTMEVLEAAGTKWNFLPFRPGLVGGHCIGVDPYYLTHKAQQVGYQPQVILAGRRINDSMAVHIADETIKIMLRKGLGVLNSYVLVLGLAFKENCPDLRNTKVVDIISQLKKYNLAVDIYDPWVSSKEAEHEYGITCLSALPEKGKYSAVILAVGHQDFVEMGIDVIKSFGTINAVFFDVKSLFPLNLSDARL